MFAQYPGLKSSCRSLWAGLPFPLAVTFGRRRAVHSFGSDRFVQPGRCTFAHNGSLHGAVRSRSASFWCPPFNGFPNPLRTRGTWLQFPTRFVDLLSGLYPHLPRLSIGLLQKSWKFPQGSILRGFADPAHHKQYERELRYGCFDRSGRTAENPPR